MTTFVLTKTEAAIDRRAIRGGVFVQDTSKVFSADGSLYFAIDILQLQERLIETLMTKRDICTVDQMLMGPPNDIQTVHQLDVDGELRLHAFEAMDGETAYQHIGFVTPFETEMEDWNYTSGSGGDFIRGAYLATRDLALSFKVTSELDPHTSANFDVYPRFNRGLQGDKA